MRRFPQFVRRLRRQPVLETKSAKLLPIGWALTLTLALAVTATGLLLFGALAWLGLPAATGKRPTVAEFLDTLKIVLAVVGGIGGVVALVVAYRKQRISEEENYRAREAARREDVKLYVDRFDKASGKLGDASAAVRLAAVHALAALADDWPGGRQMCIDVLCAYLRMPLEPEPAADQDPAGLATWRAMREVRATILRLIGAHLRRDAPISWAGADLDFTGVVFDQGADFRHAVFSGGQVLFIDAVFSGGTVVFDGADFSGGDVVFNGAKFSGGTIWFGGAKFSDGTIWFGGAKFSDSTVVFNGAVFSGGMVAFHGAEFSGGTVEFNGAEFSGGTVVFHGAEFSSGIVVFNGAKFSGSEVVFNRAEFSDGAVLFYGAEFSGGTVVFDGAKFSGGEVLFPSAKFSDGMVWFGGAKFSSGEVAFADAVFSGSMVEFSDAEFLGGEVDLTGVADWSCPPIGLPDTAEGLRLPQQPTSLATPSPPEDGVDPSEREIDPAEKPEADPTEPL